MFVPPTNNLELSFNARPMLGLNTNTTKILSKMPHLFHRPCAFPSNICRMQIASISLKDFKPRQAISFSNSCRIRRSARLIVSSQNSRNNNPFTEVVSELTNDKNALQSVKLESEVRRRAEDAISRRGGKVTVGDVAATSGLTLFQAAEALKALAADSQATLQVSSDGEILYIFDRGFKQKITSKSLVLKMEPVVNGIAQGSSYLLRIAFGTALITSVIAVSLAITVILSSSSKDDRGRGGGGGIGGPRLWFNFTDILWYWDPWYYQRRSMLRASGRDPGMGFLESVFSFVFGDGDPNSAFEQYRWEKLGQYIQQQGGVVTAEQISPFLDISLDQLKQAGGVVVDESYVLPALARFGGDPQVDAEGRILYVFPSLQQTGKAATTGSNAPLATEKKWELTAATPGQRAGVIALGAINLLGVAWLSTLLGTPANVIVLLRSGLSWVISALPLLQIYAVSFFAIPAVRMALNAARNAAIEGRNANKLRALQILQQPTPQLQSKIASAAQRAQRKIITEQDVVYRSDQAVEEQPIDVEAESWERRLERRASLRESPSSSSSGGILAPQRGSPYVSNDNNNSNNGGVPLLKRKNPNSN